MIVGKRPRSEPQKVKDGRAGCVSRSTGSNGHMDSYRLARPADPAHGCVGASAHTDLACDVGGVRARHNARRPSKLVAVAVRCGGCRRCDRRRRRCRYGQTVRDHKNAARARRRGALHRRHNGPSVHAAPSTASFERKKSAERARRAMSTEERGVFGLQERGGNTTTRPMQGGCEPVVTPRPEFESAVDEVGVQAPDRRSAARG